MYRTIAVATLALLWAFSCSQESRGAPPQQSAAAKAAAAKRRAVEAEKRAKKARAKKGEPEPEKPPEFPRDRPLERGDTGYMAGKNSTGGGWWVVQIVDENNAILKRFWQNPTIPKEYQELAWVELPTAGMVDGRPVKAENLFQVTGTKTYPTADGSQKTVMMLTQVPKDTAKSVPQEGVAPAAPSQTTPKQSEPAAAAKDDRTKWINDSYHTIVSLKKGKDWAEANDQTGAVQNTYVETGRTAEYVEVFCAANKCHVRYFDKKAEFRKDGGKWEWVANGHWE